MIARFAAEKEKQARQLSKKQSDRWPSEAGKFFKAAKSGHWDEATNLYAAFQNKYILSSTVPTNGWDGFMAKFYTSFSRTGLTPTNFWPNPVGPQWRPVDDVYFAIRQFQTWDPQLLRFYATNIIDSIPSNSVFISGTDQGFFTVPAFKDARHNGGSFCTLTPNKLADSSYLEYADEFYGKKVRIPTLSDLLGVYNSGTLAAVGWTNAVWLVNARLFQELVTNNPDCEFYYDENWHFDWPMPHLVPHGLILKINHAPLSALDVADVDKDRVYWRDIVTRLTGLDTDDAMSLPKIYYFIATVYIRKDFNHLKGDLHFVTNFAAMQTFATLKLAIARVYAWRTTHSSQDSEKRRMSLEADLAFHQTLALCPWVDVLSPYCEFLVSQNRTNDLRVLSDCIQKTFPESPTAGQVSALITNRP